MKNKNHRLHPFEFFGTHFLYTEERALLADEMGLFKTAQSIFANNKFREKNKKLRTLIVCPTSVREHWARELQKWAHPRGDSNIVYANNLEESVARAGDFQWTIVPYHLVYRLNGKLSGELQNIGFHHVILDEVHNAKNPFAIRTRAVKKIADRADYVSLLSGTPIPNTMADLYVLMSLLDPEKYPFDPDGDVYDPNNFILARQTFINLYLSQPKVVKDLFQQKMFRRLAKDYLNEQIPELQIRRIEIPLTGMHLETYQRLVEQDINIGKKIMDLEKVSLDPVLVDDSLPRLIKGRFRKRDISDKYDFLDQIVEEEMSKRQGKILIFSNLKKGIIDYLVRSYEGFGAIKITGDIPPTKGGVREKLRQQFQYDPYTRILIATTTMNEGVDLTAATAIVNLTIPWTPAEYYQRMKRSQRPGEIKKDKVDFYVPFVTIPGPQESLDKAILGMLDSKEEIARYLLSGAQVSKEELMAYDEPRRVRRIVASVHSPNRQILQYFKYWRGIGSKSALRRVKGDRDKSRIVAELYSNAKMVRNAADIYVPIIRKLGKERKLEKKVDIACGPGMLSHFLGEDSVIGIDISPDMLGVGKEIDSKRRLIQGKMHQLPLKEEFSDLALCSLSYQMAHPKRERAQTLYEMSRILRNGGYVIITLPNEYIEGENFRKFKRATDRYGFELKDYQKAVGESKIDVYVLQKVKEPSDKVYSLTFKKDSKKRSKNG